MKKTVKPEEMKCECGCGNVQKYQLIPTYDNGISYFVCSNCLVDLVNLTLTKKQYKTLMKRGHDIGEYLLHEDFYDKKGRSLQS